MTTPIRITLIEDQPEYREVIELALSKDLDQFGTADMALSHI